MNDNEQAPAATADYPDAAEPARQPIQNDPENSEYLTVDAAARRADVSHSTIRRWIKKGTLLVEQESTRTGFVYRIRADSLSTATKRPPLKVTIRPPPPDQAVPTQENEPKTPPESDANREGETSPPANPDLLVLVRELQDKNSQLSGQLGFAEGKLQAAEEKIRLLEAPPEVVATVEAVAPVEVVEPGPPPPQRRWYWLWLRAT